MSTTAGWLRVLRRQTFSSPRTETGHLVATVSPSNSRFMATIAWYSREERWARGLVRGISYVSARPTPAAVPGLPMSNLAQHFLQLGLAQASGKLTI
jgi:hypothetical protein